MISQNCQGKIVNRFHPCINALKAILFAIFFLGEQAPSQGSWGTGAIPHHSSGMGGNGDVFLGFFLLSRTRNSLGSPVTEGTPLPLPPALLCQSPPSWPCRAGLAIGQPSAASSLCPVCRVVGPSSPWPEASAVPSQPHPLPWPGWAPKAVPQRMDTRSPWCIPRTHKHPGPTNAPCPDQSIT